MTLSKRTEICLCFHIISIRLHISFQEMFSNYYETVKYSSTVLFSVKPSARC